MPTGRLRPNRACPGSVRVVFWGCVLASAVSAQRARGEEATPTVARARLDVTAFAGYRFGGQFDVPDSTQNADVKNDGSYGVSLGFRRADAGMYDEADRFELFYSRQPTHLGANPVVGPAGVTVEYLHFGASKELVREGARPYLLGAFGATRMSLDAPGASDDTRFSLSMAMGVLFPVRERFSLRLEGRGYLTFLSSDSSVFCASGSSGGACSIRASGSSLLQFELLAGASFGF
jgi:hypothetical protein